MTILSNVFNLVRIFTGTNTTLAILLALMGGSLVGAVVSGPATAARTPYEATRCFAIEAAQLQQRALSGPRARMAAASDELTLQVHKIEAITAMHDAVTAVGTLDPTGVDPAVLDFYEKKRQYYAVWMDGLEQMPEHLIKVAAGGVIDLLFGNGGETPNTDDAMFDALVWAFFNIGAGITVEENWKAVNATIPGQLSQTFGPEAGADILQYLQESALDMDLSAGCAAPAQTLAPTPAPVVTPPAHQPTTPPEEVPAPPAVPPAPPTPEAPARTTVAGGVDCSIENCTATVAAYVRAIADEHYASAADLLHRDFMRHVASGYETEPAATQVRDHAIALGVDPAECDNPASAYLALRYGTTNQQHGALTNVNYSQPAHLGEHTYYSVVQWQRGANTVSEQLELRCDGNGRWAITRLHQ